MLGNVSCHSVSVLPVMSCALSCLILMLPLLEFRESTRLGARVRKEVVSVDVGPVHHHHL